MKCLNCEGSKFEEKKVRFFPEFEGVNIIVMALAWVCCDCESRLMDDRQMDLFRRATADKFRRRQGVLTSNQIQEARMKLGLSQDAFAKYLGFTARNIQRWETYFAQNVLEYKRIRKALAL